MADLTAFGLELQDPPEDDDVDEEPEPEPVWLECTDCGYVGREVKTRLGQPFPLCTACFAERGVAVSAQKFLRFQCHEFDAHFHYVGICPLP